MKPVSQTLASFVASMVAALVILGWFLLSLHRG
jgi:hypothetical protein